MQQIEYIIQLNEHYLLKDLSFYSFFSVGTAAAPVEVEGAVALGVLGRGAGRAAGAAGAAADEAAAEAGESDQLEEEDDAPPPPPPTAALLDLLSLGGIPPVPSLSPP